MRIESVNQIISASNTGDPFAVTVCALLFYEGKYVKKNPKQAVALLQTAANAQVQWAKDLLTYIQKVDSNAYDISKRALVSSEAVNQLEQYSQTNLYAQAALGKMFRDGYVVPQKPDIGRLYLKLAAEKGCLWAEDVLQDTPPPSSFFDRFQHRNSSDYWQKPSQSTNSSQTRTSSETKQDPLVELNGLIGLQRVKEEVRSLRSFVEIQKERQRQGMRTPAISYHCVFTGSPGTGKTTVARIVAEIYRDLGILRKGHLVECARQDLIGEYVGQTAPKMNAKIDEALDGVLFIDEAYSLVQEHGNDFGAEAIATLLKRMEDDRDRLIVILAGYEGEMKKFIETNPGLQSRFNNYIHFDDYSSDELMQIFLRLLQKNQYRLAADAYDAVKQLFTAKIAENDRSFGNGRFVRNVFEKVIQRQAVRLSQISNKSREQLELILVKDISV